MIVRIGRRGTSFKGASLYYLHDKRQPGEAVRLSSDRVAWTECLNLANDNPDLAWREMWRTASDQQELKREAGLPVGGNRVRAPVLPIVLSWAEADRPSPEHQRAAAYAFLKQMGWEKHQALLVAHNDTEHQHVHILLNRVDPETGRALTEGFSHRRAQAWALRYQRENGQHWCPQREINARARQTGERTHDHSQPYPLAKDAVAASRPAYDAEERLATEARSEKGQLSERHQDEREHFLASGKRAIRDIRTKVFVETRAEYKPQWRALHAAARMAAGAPEREAQIKEQRAELWREVRTTTKGRQDMAVKAFIAERREQFQEIKDRQKEERAELRDLMQARDAGAPFDANRLAELTAERGALRGEGQAQTRTAGRGAANENGSARDSHADAEAHRRSAHRQATLTNSQSMPAIQRAANRELKDRDRKDRSPVELTDGRIANRVQEMRIEDEQRRDRSRDGFGRERERGRER